jgi:TonB family protein
MKLPRSAIPSVLCLLLCPLSTAKPLASDPEADVGIAIHEIGTLAYPPAMLYSGVRSGEVRIAISVDENGRLTDYLVIGYTDPGFVDTAVNAVKRWTYEPALASGRRQSARSNVLFVFKDEGVIVQRLPGAIERLYVSEIMRERYVYEPCRLRDLDRIPTPVHVVSPVARLEGKTHTVTVGFFIDESGRVRMPAVERESADDLLAVAAVTAVEQWRFEPPLRHGSPVLVYAQQDFTFKPKAQP